MRELRWYKKQLRLWCIYNTNERSFSEARCIRLRYGFYRYEWKYNISYPGDQDVVNRAYFDEMNGKYK